MDISEFLRQSIRLFVFVQRQHAAGKHFYYGTDDAVEQEIIFAPMFPAIADGPTEHGAKTKSRTKKRKEAETTT